MKKILKPSDFEYFKDKTDRIIAATIANEIISNTLRKIINDPTKGAVGEYANGYRECLKDIINELEDK